MFGYYKISTTSARSQWVSCRPTLNKTLQLLHKSKSSADISRDETTFPPSGRLLFVLGKQSYRVGLIVYVNMLSDAKLPCKSLYFGWHVNSWIITDFERYAHCEFTRTKPPHACLNHRNYICSSLIVGVHELTKRVELWIQYSFDIGPGRFMVLATSLCFYQQLYTDAQILRHSEHLVYSATCIWQLKSVQFYG